MVSMVIAMLVVIAMGEVAALYRHRFPGAERPQKVDIWKALCSGYFQKFVRPEHVVLDLACGYGEFINNIAAAEKHAVDLNPDAPRFLAPNIHFHAAPATGLRGIADASMDVVFTSHFLEHLPDTKALEAGFSGGRRVPRSARRFLVRAPQLP